MVPSDNTPRPFTNRFLAMPAIFWLAVLFLYLAHHFFGPSLIADMYHGRSAPFLNALFEGRDSHPLEFYYAKADRMVYLLIVLLSLISILSALVVVWIKRGGPDQAGSARVLIFCLSVAFIALLIYMKVEFNEEYWLIFLKEDGIVEYLTSASYFIAFGFALAIAIRFARTKYMLYVVMYFVLSVGLFFNSMEEISWGQRVFGLETPEAFEQYNYQGELNIHNLFDYNLQHILYILVGFCSAFSRFLVPGKFTKRYPMLA